MTTDDDKPALQARRFVDLALIDDPALVTFDDHDRSACYQIMQHLAFLGEEKAFKFINLLDKKPLFRI